jgi:hypothetical protein
MFFGRFIAQTGKDNRVYQFHQPTHLTLCNTKIVFHDSSWPIG